MMLSEMTLSEDLLYVYLMPDHLPSDLWLHEDNLDLVWFSHSCILSTGHVVCPL